MGDDGYSNRGPAMSDGIGAMEVVGFVSGVHFGGPGGVGFERGLPAGWGVEL